MRRGGTRLLLTAPVPLRLGRRAPHTFVFCLAAGDGEDDPILLPMRDELARSRGLRVAESGNVPAVSPALRSAFTFAFCLAAGDREYDPILRPMRDELARSRGLKVAESGNVPVPAVSPALALLVSGIEIEKRAKSQDRPPLLPFPSESGGAQ